MVFVTLNIERRCRALAAAGFTLAESLIASALLAVAAVSIAAPIMAARQQVASADTNLTALSLSRQLIEEIAGKPFAEADGSTVRGPEAGETRANYSAADDYHGYSDSTSGLKMMDGSAVSIPGTNQYTRTVKVEYRSSPGGSAVQSGDFALVTVTVAPLVGQPVQLLQLLTRIPLKR